MVQVAQKTVVDNFSELAIEQCLLQKLPEMFTPEVVFALEEDEIESIAAESEESRMERIRVTEKSRVLDHTLKVLNSLNRHKNIGGSTFPSHCHYEEKLINILVQGEDEDNLPGGED